MLSLPHLYWHIQHGVSMLIFNTFNSVLNCIFHVTDAKLCFFSFFEGKRRTKPDPSIHKILYTYIYNFVRACNFKDKILFLIVFSSCNVLFIPQLFRSFFIELFNRSFGTPSKDFTQLVSRHL